MGRHTDMVNMELLTVSEDKQCKREKWSRGLPLRLDNH